jgi:hypothetical protein
MTEPRTGRFGASLAAAISFLRGLRFFFCNRPRTPLRVLCLMAFDTAQILRKPGRLSTHTLQTLAALLDFGACANRFFDGKGFSRREYGATRRLLKRARTRVAVNEYVSRLRDIEKRRPSAGAGDWQPGTIQSYRESVIRLSLGVVAATALDMTIEEGVRATHSDEVVEMLYRIVMLCQVIDDVRDFTSDLDDGLPSFLTAHASPSQALALTCDAATRYARQPGVPSSPHVFPFRVALLGVYALAKAAILFGQWRLRLHSLRTPRCPACGERGRSRGCFPSR